MEFKCVVKKRIALMDLKGKSNSEFMGECIKELIAKGYVTSDESVGRKW